MTLRRALRLFELSGRGGGEGLGLVFDMRRLDAGGAEMIESGREILCRRNEGVRSVIDFDSSRVYHSESESES